MLAFSKKERSDNKCLAVGFHRDGISLALLEFASDQGLILERLEFREVRSSEAVSVELKILMDEIKGQNYPCVCVLGGQNYSLVQLEAPDVQGDELKAAVKWRIKDLIDFPVEQAVIDVIKLPRSKRAGAPRMMYAVAAKKQRIQEIVGLFEMLGIELEAIDIPELALRNLTYADADANRSSALLYLSPSRSLIEICENGSLCLARHLNIDFTAFEMPDVTHRHEAFDLLSLEIQRSLDYYESQYANGAASNILMATDGEVSMQDFIDVAGSYLTQPIQELQSLQKIRGIDRFSKKLVSHCLPTLGAAMRDFAWIE